MTDLKTLRELAEKASNPWHDDIFHDHHVGVCIARKGCKDESDQCEDDAEFMQAASPQTILALLDRYERAVEVITSIASVGRPRHGSADYWLKIDHASCARTLETDTNLARDFLKSIEGNL